MARIRTIKPEFPQSESMGRVSRDARLCFVMLWTIADDSGRLRGNSRMLASLLFPYDDDAPALIDTWLSELEREDCVMRYQVEGTTYLQIAKWLSHQKIDKPSESRIPPFDESSRILAKGREASGLDLGPRTLDLGRDQDLSSLLSQAPTRPLAEVAPDAPLLSLIPPPKPPSLPDCPHLDLLSLWAEVLPELPQHNPDMWAGTRADHLRARWRETAKAKAWTEKAQGITYFRKLFGFVGQSPFLTGRTPAAQGKRPFQIELEWLVNPTNWAKVHEGKYHEGVAA